MAKKKSPPIRIHGPYLAAAVLCDMVLEGKDSSMSVLRIIDSINVLVPPGYDVEKGVPVIFNMLVSFKMGTAKGEKVFRLIVHTPKNKKHVIQTMPINFQGPEHSAVNLAMQSQMNVRSEGVFWFDIVLDRKVFTRIPLIVAFQKLPLLPDGTDPRSGL